MQRSPKARIPLQPTKQRIRKVVDTVLKLLAYMPTLIATLLPALQRGQKLQGSAELKHVSGAASLLVFLVAIVAAFLPIPLTDEQVIQGILLLLALKELGAVILTYATSKDVGLPPPPENR